MLSLFGFEGGVYKAPFSVINHCGKGVVFSGNYRVKPFSLSAVVHITPLAHVYLYGVFTRFITALSVIFSTEKLYYLPLLNSSFYPLSTVPIKISTK
jgi:hypothetical protein